MINKKIRVLIVDDSIFVQTILTKCLSLDPEIEVIGSAADPYEARDKIVNLKPDVLTLDVEMPKMNGLEFLKKLMPQYPMPVIMVSSLTNRSSQITLDALSAGAVDFVVKPSPNLDGGLSGLIEVIQEKIKIASKVNVKNRQSGKSSSKEIQSIEGCSGLALHSKIIAIGASTGGTDAIETIIKTFPKNMPSTVIVQHMPTGFTKLFADRINSKCQVNVKEAESGDILSPGTVLIAPGGYQMTLVKTNLEYRVLCRQGELVCGHAPSVEVLFNSVAQVAGPNAIGVMLTGMGHDGADAMVKMRKAGAKTMAQDEATSVVFGMPKEAYERGGAEVLVPLDRIPTKVNQYLFTGDK